MAAILRRRVVLGSPPDDPAPSVAELFHENTKLHRLPGLTAIPPERFTPVEMRAMAAAWKTYPTHPRVALPDPSTLPVTGRSFDDVLLARRTIRTFADAGLTLRQLSQVLHFTYGITGEAGMPGGGRQPLRAAPSAGALYPVELYLGVRRVEGLAPGIYHYEVPDHALALLRPGDPTTALYDACCGQDYARQAAAVVLIAAALDRTERKYGERGYRYVLLDAGHLAQNLLLAATAMNTGGFFDDAVHALLRLDGIDEVMLYVAFIGPSPGAATR